MTISAELITRYTTEVDVDWRHAFILSHPNAETKYIISHTEEFMGMVDGTLQFFLPVPTEITPASRDDSGQSDMRLSWCGIGGEALAFLYDALEDATKPITCLYSIFILGDSSPQLDPWLEFQLTSIQVTEETVTATASRSNIINVPFPREVYRVERFPGLRRR